MNGSRRQVLPQPALMLPEIPDLKGKEPRSSHFRDYPAFQILESRALNFFLPGAGTAPCQLKGHKST